MREREECDIKNKLFLGRNSYLKTVWIQNKTSNSTRQTLRELGEMNKPTNSNFYISFLETDTTSRTKSLKPTRYAITIHKLDLIGIC